MADIAKLMEKNGVKNLKNTAATNSELEEAVVELAQNQADMEEALVELAELLGGD